MSGIYIPKMRMPSCCGECRFLDDFGDYPLCIITDEQRGYKFRIKELRMPHCPLIPAADVVEVVRCENCRYSDKYCHCSNANWWTNESDYCSRGERRKDD